MTDFISELYSSRPRGGMQAVQVDKGVKVTHTPTGIFAVCEYERSQHRNKRVALAMVEAGIKALEDALCR